MQVEQNKTTHTHLFFLMRAEIQENVQVLELSGRAFQDEIFQSGHAKVNPRL